MKKLEVIKRKISIDYSMAELHSHPYFEIYFLMQGKREILQSHNSFWMAERCFCVFSPFSLHKTQGGSHERILLYIDKDFLANEEIAFLEKLASSGALRLDDDYYDVCMNLLKQVCVTSDKKDLDDFVTPYHLPIVKTLLYYLRKQSVVPINTSHTLPNLHTDPLISNVLAFFHKNFSNPITLEQLCKEFFVSKTTLCSRFKQSIGCTVLDYLTQLRINNAISALLEQKDSIELIAQKHGFTSTAYFRMVFKKIIGCSPTEYRKKALQSK